MNTDVKALIAEARRSGNRNDVDDWPELAAQLITDLADALEVLSASPLVADEEAVREWERKEFAISNGSQAWVEFQGELGSITESLFASGVIRKAEPLMADREKLVNSLIQDAVRAGIVHMNPMEIADALFASGVIKRRGNVPVLDREAFLQALEKDRYDWYVDHMEARTENAFERGWDAAMQTARSIGDVQAEALAPIEALLNRPIHPYGDTALPTVSEREFLRDAYDEDFVDDLEAILAAALRTPEKGE